MTGGVEMNAIKHFKTITNHKMLVMKYCFKVGLYKQGLLHDLSKYSFVEFSITKEIKAQMEFRDKLRGYLQHGCITKAEINIIMNIGSIIP